MRKTFNKKGFIQIPILIGIIFVLSVTTVSYFGVKQLNQNKNNTTSIQAEGEKNIEVGSSTQKVNTPKVQPTKNSNESTTKVEVNIPVLNVDLKIEQCKATKENNYNSAILKINQATNDRLKVTFDSLDQQYKTEAQKINDPYQLKILYDNQQIFWKNQKAEIELSKQKAIDQVNLLLSEEYQKCLSK